MKRSAHVSAPLLAAAALSLLSGCRQMQRCVNENNVVVDDSFCKDQPNQPQQRSDGHGGFIPFFPYRYYYGGFGGYSIGTPASGGSFTPSAGVSYVTRGGFGSSFAEGGSHSSGSSSSSHGSSGGE